MSTIGSSIETSLLQAAQAQQVAGKEKDRQRAAVADRARRYQDLVDLRVSGVEDVEAPRKLPGHDSEQNDAEQRATRSDLPQVARATDEDGEQRPSIDVRG